MMKPSEGTRLASVSASSVRAIAVLASAAWPGRMIAPIDSMAHTGPCSVSMTLSRATSRKRSAAWRNSSSLQLLVARMAVIDAPDDAEGFGRTPVRARIPAPGIFEPVGGLAILAAGPEQIFDLIGNAFPLVLVDAAHHRVIARGEIIGIEKGGKGAPGGEKCGRAMQDLRRIGAPEDLIRFDHPMIGRFADRQDGLAHPLELLGADHTRQRFDRRAVGGASFLAGSRRIVCRWSRW